MSNISQMGAKMRTANNLSTLHPEVKSMTVGLNLYEVEKAHNPLSSSRAQTPTHSRHLNPLFFMS